jgi:3-hydroxymyristoyl/3-hydroxydecanoyl-(acyl carrier protein) dehydratase
MTVPAAASVHSLIEIPQDHPAFAGHFPKFPVLPGAVLLDEALHAIESARGIDLRDWRIASVKFMDAVRPGDALRLEHAAPHSGVIRFTIHAAARLVASGSLARAAQPAGGAPVGGAPVGDP